MFERAKSEFSQRLDKFMSCESQYQSQINQFQEELMAIKNHNNQQAKEISQLNLKISEIRLEDSALEQVIALKRDIEQQLVSTTQRVL